MHQPEKSSKRKPDEKTKCFRCGKKGHRKEKCPRGITTSKPLSFMKLIPAPEKAKKTLAEKMQPGTNRKRLAEGMPSDGGEKEVTTEKTADALNVPEPPNPKSTTPPSTNSVTIPDGVVAPEWDEADDEVD